MKQSEIRQLSEQELVQKEKEYRTQVFTMRTQGVSGTVVNPGALRNARKDLARVLTEARKRKHNG